MTAVGWVVYGASIATVVITLGLLLWTLQVRMMREMHGEIVATYHSARHRSDDRTHSDSDSVRALPEAKRNQFANDWRSLQPRFINDPDDAVKEADRLVSEVMQTCGYPMEEFAERATDHSVEHPTIVSHYRETHRLAQRAAHGAATVDEERRALEEYRELFAELLGDNMPVERTAQTG